MTLNCYKFELSRNFADLRGNNGTTNEDRPVLSATELLPTKCTFQRCIDYVDIFGRSSARGLQLQYSGQRRQFSTCTRENISHTISNMATDTIDHQQKITYR